MASRTVSNRFSSKNLLNRVIARRWAVIGLAAAVTIAMGIFLPRLKFSTTVYDLVIQDLPETRDYGEFKKLFGSEEIIRIVVKCQDVFSPLSFAKIGQLSDQAAAIAGVKRIISLPEIKKAVDLSGNWSLEKFSALIADVPLFQRNLISSDHRTTALTLVLAQDADHGRVIQAVETLIKGADPSLRLYQIGMPLVSQAMAFLAERDFLRLPPITMLLLAIVLVCIYRSFRLLWLPLACVTIAQVWAFGLIALIGMPLSMLTMIVPVFLIAVGTAYCLHILAEYVACQAAARTPAEAAFKTFERMTFPTLLAVLTTLIGLGSLLLNRISAIKEFALFACIGMLSLLAVMLILLPALLAALPLKPAKQRRPRSAPHIVDRFIAWIIRLNLNRQRVTLPLLALITLFCGAGLFRLRVETNPVDYFRRDTQISMNFHDIYRDLSGSFPLNVTLAGQNEDYFEDPAHLAGIEKLQAYLETLPGIDKTVSFADYLKLVNYAANRFDRHSYVLPTEDWEVRMLINTYKSMLGTELLTPFMSGDFSKTNILLLTHLSSSNDFLHTRDTIRDYARQHLAGDEVLDVTGFGMVMAASSRHLTLGQVKSLSLTMVLVLGVMFLLFLSAKVGLVAIVPNLFPIVINFGLMGWLGFELSMMTSLIASIALGLAVDDTIHYLVRFNEEFKRDLDEKKALTATLKHIGRPIVFTTLAICIGFSILCLSSFKATAIFGAMMVVTLLSAMVGDLILLPSLMLHMELVTLWDLVRLRLGREPNYGIEIFNGLSRTQVHSIIMAGALRQLKSGEVLFKKGEPSDSMYALIAGELDVVDYHTDHGCLDQGLTKRINHLRAGEVVGEMGSLRGAQRSATVVATGPAELLLINWKMIKRLQWLYPPVAHKFFMNVLAILCGRLEKLSRCYADESVTDDLTGLCNYKGLCSYLEAEISRSKRYGDQLALCLISLDGSALDQSALHDEIEKILQSISQALSRQIRGCDRLARIDYRTLALLLARTSQGRANQAASRLQAILQQKDYRLNGIPLELHFSISGFPSDGGQTAENFVSEALNRQ